MTPSGSEDVTSTYTSPVPNVNSADCDSSDRHFPPLSFGQGLTFVSTRVRLNEESTMGGRVVRFSQLLRELRRERQLGIKKLAPELKVNYTYLSKLENERAVPSDELIERVAAYFNYDPDKLYLAAKKIPKDAVEAIRLNPEVTLPYLRKLAARGRRSK
jgi:HTH-type transcriptional regulator, competence development regulator